MAQGSIASGSAGVVPVGAQAPGGLRAPDWSATALGERQSWPPALETAAAIVFASRQPMFVCWGADFTVLCNDACAALGLDVELAPGRPAAQAWPALWAALGPEAHAVLRDNEGRLAAARWVVEPAGAPSRVADCVVSLSPVPGAGGRPAGLLGTCLERAGLASPAAVHALAGPAASRPRVLIVDDSLLIQESAAAMLQGEGYEVRTASDGLEAIDIVRTWQPCVAMLDLQMPRLGGLDAARRLRAEFPRGTLGLLMLSGVTLNDTWLRHAEAAGFDACIDKTAAPDIWLAHLRRYAPPAAAA